MLSMGPVCILYSDLFSCVTLLRELLFQTDRNPDEDDTSATVTTLNGATLVETSDTVKLEDNAERRGRTCNC